MSYPSRIYTGSQYTAPVAFLLLAIIAPIAAIWLTPSSIELIPALTGLTFSGLCGAGAWFRWKWYSESSVPSIVTQPAVAK